MLTSMILLISGLILSSAMLIHYTKKKTGSTASPSFSFSELFKKGKTLSAQVKAKAVEEKKQAALTEEPKDTKATESGIKQFFSRNNSTVRWPKVKLTGFGKSSDGESGFAIINDKHIIVGQKISKVTLIEIGVNSVVVEYKGERKTLAVDPR